jgi:hypothetical protein
LLKALGGGPRQGVNGFAKLSIQDFKHREASGQGYRLQGSVELLIVFGEPGPPAWIVHGATQMADNLSDDLLRCQWMEVGDQQASAQQPGVMRQGHDVTGVHLEARDLAGEARVHDHKGPAFRAEQVHHFDAPVIEYAMHLEHGR